MAKSIIKEFFIILLLILAIVLLLGILFYNYLPTSKIVPTKVEEYALSAEAQEELNKELNNTDSEEIIKTYVLDATDIELYEKTKEYNKGKVNPFASYGTTPTGTGNTSGNSTGNSNNTGAGNSSNSNTSSGTFLNTVGK